MNLYLKKLFLAVVFAGLFMAGTPAHAAPVKDYKRVVFAFKQPAHLTIDNKGTTVILKFDAKLSESADAVAGQLGGYVTKAQLSASGRELTLTLTKPYRIRQFVSGAGIGIDVIGEPDETAAKPKPAEAAKPEPITTTKKPTPTVATKTATPAKPAATKPIAEKKPADKKLEKKTAPSPIAKPAADAAITTTKKTVEPPTATKPEAKTKPAAPITSTKKEAELAAAVKQVETTAKPDKSAEPTPPPAADVLTTKHDNTAAQESATPNLYTTKQPEKPVVDDDVANPPAPEKPLLTTKQPPAPEPAKPAEAAAPPPAAKPADATPAAPHQPGESLVVTAQRTGAGTIINFPWNERTAAAVFERSRDIWIVFSRPTDVRIPLLRTVLPKPVVDITQYNYEGNTVLRLVTDGTIHATSSLVKGRYDWNITLSTALATPSLDVSMKTDTTYAIRQLLLGAFDVSPSLRFYDPEVGDLLVIIPSYEGGRGVSHERNFPEFSILNSGQGITIASTRPDITVQSSRAGVAVYAEGGLAISENLPLLSDNAAPVPGMTSPSDVMFPYDQWYIPQVDWFDERQKRLDAVSNASRDATPDSLMALATLYLGEGLGVEAHGYLSLIQEQFPDYYKSHKLALLHAASYFMFGHIPEAAQELSAPELIGVAEADLWREVIGLYTPQINTVQKIQQTVEGQNAEEIAAPPPPPPSTVDKKIASNLSSSPTSTVAKPEFHFLKYNRLYIHFYPPRIRQRLAVVAADAYIQNGNEEKALAVFDTLSHDGIMGKLRPDAEYVLSLIAINKKQYDNAKDILEKLSKQNDNLYIKSRARYSLTVLKYNQGEANADDTANALENIRYSWRGDALEYKILTSLAQLYQDGKQYDNLLRTWKAMLDGFPNNPDTLAISGDMGQLFKNLYLNGLADEMPPLKSLSLFYEFRELTPVGPEGDEIIRRLADRLAAFDLLDRATQLLEHQIKFRITNQERSRVGARLALLHLLNHHPKEALDVLQITNYGDNPVDLALQRQQLAAEALNSLGKQEQALSMLSGDTTRSGALLRLDILWSLQDWPNVVNRAEDLLAERHNLTSPLTQEETEILLKLAIGYSFEGDTRQLRYLRDYYSGLIPDTAYKQIFDFITNDTTPLDPADINMLTKQISNTETFLSTFKSKIAEGKLSEAIK